MGHDTAEDLRALFQKARTESAFMLQLNERLSKDPAPLFEQALAMLKELPGKSDKRAIEIKAPVVLKFSDETVVAASTQRLRPKRAGYCITISAGLYHLLNDITEIAIAQSAVVSSTGDLITGPNFSQEELRGILEESVREYVTHSNSWPRNKELSENNERRLVRELRLSAAQQREYLHYARRLLAIVFLMGHELGHVVEWPSALRLWTRFEKPRVEQELSADAIGAKYLVDFLSVPPRQWEYEWVASGDYRYDIIMNGANVNEIRSEYFHGTTDPGEMLAEFQGVMAGVQRRVVRATEYETCLATGLCAVGALFVVLELVERAARELGIRYEVEYPAAATRYERFRRACIDFNGVKEDAFTESRGMQSPPDTQYETFTRIGSALSWKSGRQ